MSKLAEILTESTTTTYYKVTTEPTEEIPGYLTKSHDLIMGYLSAFLDSKPKVYVTEFNIDTSKLKVIEGAAFGPRKNILPGYYGTEILPEDGIKEPLDVIVWNEPIKSKIVGAYLHHKNIDKSKPFTKGRYIANGRAWQLPYTTDDINEEQ